MVKVVHAVFYHGSIINGSRQREPPEPSAKLGRDNVQQPDIRGNKKANEDKKAKKLFSISTRILKDTEANFRLNIICLRKIVVILVCVRNLGQ